MESNNQYKRSLIFGLYEAFTGIKKDLELESRYKSDTKGLIAKNYYEEQKRKEAK